MRWTCSCKYSSRLCTAIWNGESRSCLHECTQLLQLCTWYRALSQALSCSRQGYDKLIISWIVIISIPSTSAIALMPTLFPKPPSMPSSPSFSWSTATGLQFYWICLYWLTMERSMWFLVIIIRWITDKCRIFDNQHLLDATEIFRKLNVHKKVDNLPRSLTVVLVLTVNRNPSLSWASISWCSFSTSTAWSSLWSGTRRTDPHELLGNARTWDLPREWMCKSMGRCEGEDGSWRAAAQHVWRLWNFALISQCNVFNELMSKMDALPLMILVLFFSLFLNRSLNSSGMLS